MSLEALRQPGEFLPLRGKRQSTADFELVFLEAIQPLNDPIYLVAGLQQLCSSTRVAPQIGRLPASLVPHFLDSFARRGRLGLHISARGEDAHHVTEAAFKAMALALREAVEPDGARSGIASTKGVL